MTYLLSSKDHYYVPGQLHLPAFCELYLPVIEISGKSDPSESFKNSKIA
jgi:hypothetical protein